MTGVREHDIIHKKNVSGQLSNYKVFREELFT